MTRPEVWLGQSVNTSSICADHAQLKTASFLTSLGCAIRRPRLRQTHLNSSLREKLGVAGRLMIDSGGFALMSSPDTKWTVHQVGDLIAGIEADIFVSLDLPPSPSDDGPVRRAKIRKSTANYAELLERFPLKTIMPVVHGRTMGEIRLSVELLTRYCRHPDWVGLGGIVPLLQNRRPSKYLSRMGPEVFIGEAIAAIRRSFPAARIHAFGAGGTMTFPAVYALGADSGDSIGWRQAAGFGSIFLPLKTQRVVRWNETRRPPRKTLDSADMEQIARCGCPSCTSAASLRRKLILLKKNFYYRSIHNAWTIHNQHKYWPCGRTAMRNLVRSGALGDRWACAVSAAESI